MGKQIIIKKNNSKKEERKKKDLRRLWEKLWGREGARGVELCLWEKDARRNLSL